MFEAAELGSAIDKEAFEEQLPGLRVALVNAQYDLRKADFPVLAQELQFLDYHLKELDNGYSSQSPVNVFLMGENRWLDLEDWPPPGAQMQEWFLTSDGSARATSR